MEEITLAGEAAEEIAANSTFQLAYGGPDVDRGETLKNQDVGSIYFQEATNSHIANRDGETRDIWVRVVKPNFDGGRWSFHDGSAKFGADLEDRS